MSAPRRGFTLIEVLVALAIAAIGLSAVLSVVTNSSRNAVYLRDKIYAAWIGENKIAEARLGQTLPSVDKTNGELDYGGGKWKWEQTVTQTDVPGLRRIDVAVRRSDDPAENPIVTVSGFAGRTQLSAPPSGSSWDLSPSATGGSPSGVTTTTGGTTTTTPTTGIRPATGGGP
ncbi:MAG: type II secretion system minor pseudopilin GspI [Proteobacteria bacterium]|nr:type II secretion system minor pseudopilin GspI [Pseudomonadota bacterium]